MYYGYFVGNKSYQRGQHCANIVTVNLSYPAYCHSRSATVFKNLCSSTKLTFVLMLRTWCVFHVFDCALSVYHLSSHWVCVCVFTLSLHCYQAHGELKMVSKQHIMNTKKNPENTLAPFCWVVPILIEYSKLGSTPIALFTKMSLNTQL